MPEHQKTTRSKSSPIHLGQLISIVLGFQATKDQEFDRLVVRHAAWLALRDIRQGRLKSPDILDQEGQVIATRLELAVDNPSDDSRIVAESGNGGIRSLEVERRFLRLVHRGKMTRADLFESDLLTLRLLVLYVGQAEDQLLYELASRSGSAILKPTVWEFVVGEIVQVCEIAIDDDRLRTYAIGVKLGGSLASDPISRKIAELHNGGFTNLLLDRIWSEYAAQAAEMDLPTPREGFTGSSRAVPKSIEMKGRAKTVEDAIESEESAEPSSGNRGHDEPSVGKPCLAMAILLMEPEISPTELARRVEVSRGTLYSKSPKWKGVRQTLMARDFASPPKGYKTADGQIEAIDDGDGE